MRTLLVVAMGVALAACGRPPTERITEDNQGVTYVPGNPTCASLGMVGFEYKVDPPNSGTYNLPDGVNSVTVATTDGIYFDWTATLGIDAVIVKGGDNANVYEYDPEATSDAGLHSPINPNNGTPYGLSHISFCYDYEVVVTKTANPALDRTWTWDVAKSAAQSSITLSTGQTFTMGYAVTVSATGYSDSNWSASGTISVYNPAPMAATITGVSDMVDGTIAATVDCGVQFPYTLASTATLTCSYSVALPDGATRVNEATASTSGPVGPDSGTATIDFASATVNGFDDCVDVDDDKYGSLGQVCVGDAPKTINYTMDIGPYAICGQYTVDNTATIVTNDSQTSDSSSASVAVDVPCIVGCTLTPGYWKTHSEYGPAPYDDTWAQKPAGADTPFFLSGKSYIQVLWTAPKGNAYYILAHAFIAAELNMLNDADFSAAIAAYNDARALFAAYTPADIEVLRGNNKTRKQFIALAKTLDDYNNGLIGPGHCSE